MILCEFSILCRLGQVVKFWEVAWLRYLVCAFVIYTWSLWTMVNKCCWPIILPFREVLWLMGILVPSWVLPNFNGLWRHKVSKFVLEEISDARCLNGRHEKKLDLLWLFIEIMPTLKVFSDLECGKVEFIFPPKEGSRVFFSRPYVHSRRTKVNILLQETREEFG